MEESLLLKYKWDVLVLSGTSIPSFPKILPRLLDGLVDLSAYSTSQVTAMHMLRNFRNFLWRPAGAFMPIANIFLSGGSIDQGSRALLGRSPTLGCSARSASCRASD